MCNDDLKLAVNTDLAVIQAAAERIEASLKMYSSCEDQRCRFAHSSAVVECKNMYRTIKALEVAVERM